jgi:hypothetical protein
MFYQVKSLLTVRRLILFLMQNPICICNIWSDISVRINVPFIFTCFKQVGQV